MVQGGRVGIENRMQSYSKNNFVLFRQPEDPRLKTEEGFKAAQILPAVPPQENKMKDTLPAISCFMDNDLTPRHLQNNLEPFLIDFDNQIFWYFNSHPKHPSQLPTERGKPHSFCFRYSPNRTAIITKEWHVHMEG